MRHIFLLLALWINVSGFAAVRILTFHYNQPDFIELQYKTLKKFLVDDFELIVFNDAKTLKNEQGIENVCNEYGIKCVRFKQQWHLTDPLNSYLKARLQEPSTVGIWGWNAGTSLEEIASNPSVRHSHVIQYALDHYGYDHDDVVVIMDGDNFLIKPLSIRRLLGSYDIVGFNQKHDELGRGRKQSQIAVPQNVEMLWVVFIAFRPSVLPNPHELKFHVDVISGVPYLPNHQIGDTGAAHYKYLQKYPHLQVEAYPWQSSGIFREYFSSLGLKGMGFSDGLMRFIHEISPGNVQFFVFEHFMHFAAVSTEDVHHAQKVHALRRFINELITDPAQRELKHYYDTFTTQPSDINEHLPVLCSLAKECSSVVEIGVRSMVSSWGILQGLVESPFASRSYLGIDIAMPPLDTLNLARRLAGGNGISFNFSQANDLDTDIESTDMLFIDSLHTYCHLTFELEKFSPKIRKFIALHDTSPPWENVDDNQYHGDYTEYPLEYDRTKRGLWPAVTDFLQRHPEWILQERRYNNHGFTILKRK